MEPKSLAELQQLDERTLYFGPFGLGGPLRAEAVAEYHQKIMARLDLGASVPDTVRRSFDRVRGTYCYGVLDYDFFTVAHDQARLVAEPALRTRFLEYHAAGVPFVDVDGNEHVLTPANFDELLQTLADGRLRKPASWRLRVRGGQRTIPFNGMLDSLLRWARIEGLLHGQRNHRHEKVLKWFRNRAAHPSSYHLLMPGYAALAISDLAEFINHLWGEPTSGGRLYPAPVQREVRVLGWTATGDMYSGNPRFFGDAPAPTGLTCVLVRADLREDLFVFDAQYETTHTPCELLWGPGAWSEAAAWYEREQPTGDEIALLDRFFLVRYHDRRLYLPRNPQTAAGLTPQERTGDWFLLQADGPHEVFNHLRQLLATTSDCARSGPCQQCPVETIRRGTWQQVMDYLTPLGVDLTPRTPPDVRAASHMPRWNTINEDDGGWSIPAGDI